MQCQIVSYSYFFSKKLFQTFKLVYDTVFSVAMRPMASLLQNIFNRMFITPYTSYTIQCSSRVVGNQITKNNVGGFSETVLVTDSVIRITYLIPVIFVLASLLQCF